MSKIIPEVAALYSTQVAAIAEAIATAEGYGVPGAIPTERNNPGDLENGSGTIITFNSIQEGWYNLCRQVHWMLTGLSHVYQPDMTIQEVANKWTQTQPEDWARNVTQVLGCTVDTQLKDAGLNWTAAGDTAPNA